MGRSSSDYGFSKLHNGERVRSTFSYATYQAAAAANQTMTDLIAGASLESFNVASTARRKSPPPSACPATSSRSSRASAIAGRTIEESDDQPGAEPSP